MHCKSLWIKASAKCINVNVKMFVCVWGGGKVGREGVQLPDSLMDEAVRQSAGPGLETPQSPP